MENVVQLQLEREKLHRAQESEIAAIRQKYRAPLVELERYLDLETSWVENWARAKPGRTREQPPRSNGAHATLGFQTVPTQIERASRRWTWSRIALSLATLAWGKRYLRIPAPEVDKDALLADLAGLSLVELRNAGLKIVQGERFFLTPHHETESVASPEPIWQEAA